MKRVAGVLLAAWLPAVVWGAQPVSHPAKQDVIVDLPADAWTQHNNRALPCQRCCLYENRSYSEGAVVKMSGVLLQCMRDKESLGSPVMIWQRMD